MAVSRVAQKAEVVVVVTYVYCVRLYWPNEVAVCVRFCVSDGARYMNYMR